MTTPAQTREIHVLRRRIAGFVDGDYRALLQEMFGAASSTALVDAQAARLIAELRKLAGPNRFGGRAPSQTASGPYARVLQALWIAAWNLGLAHQRDDRAMLAFVGRQTGLSHTRFLVDAADARKAIEGLKAWLARESGLKWPGDADPLTRKRAVLSAQTRIVRAFRPTFDPQAFGLLEGLGESLAHYDGARLDQLSTRIGRIIRREASKQEKAA